MNLVAKEYVVAQDPDNPGVLVLSQFAGAAEEMSDALIVNPYNIDDMAMQLHKALTMPLEERKTRHRALREQVFAHDAKAWLDAFLVTLKHCRRITKRVRELKPGKHQTPRSAGRLPDAMQVGPRKACEIAKIVKAEG